MFSDFKPNFLHNILFWAQSFDFIEGRCPSKHRWWFCNAFSKCPDGTFTFWKCSVKALISRFDMLPQKGRFAFVTLYTFVLMNSFKEMFHYDNYIYTK